MRIENKDLILQEIKDCQERYEKEKEIYKALTFREKQNIKYPVINLKELNYMDNTYIYGAVGVGKTHFAKEWISLIGGKYYKWNDIVNEALPPNTFNINMYMQKIMIIDDFLSKKMSEFNMEIFYDILDHRIEHDKITIITTNYTPKRFIEKLKQVSFGDEVMAERIESRFQAFNFLKIEGKDLRRKK